LQESYPEAIPLLPSRRYAGYVESLQAIGIKEFAYFPDESNVSVVDPVVTECPHQFATTSAECLLKVRQKVWQYLGLDGNLEATKIVYVSRIKARGRFVKNEPELVSTLERLGAKIVCFEDLTFLQQVALMRETKLLISIHGAALTNMMFMPNGGRVIELIPYKNGLFEFHSARLSFRHDACYVRLADAMEHRHDHILCKADNRWNQKTHMANLTVEIEDLLNLVIETSLCRA
jgi:capsular polysaccharide biosynthesis protein